MCETGHVQQAFGVSVPETVPEMCRRDVSGVLVYDAQVGILQRVREREGMVERMRVVLDAAREVSAPVFYCRHVSLPTSHMGVSALRAAMAWQRLTEANRVVSPFPPAAAATQLADELSPQAGEPVFDKLGMSAFVGTPLESRLRDRRLTTLIVIGAVLEIGIEPTARHAADLGFLPVIVDDACAVVEPAAAERAFASLDYSLLTYRASAAVVAAALRA